MKLEFMINKVTFESNVDFNYVQVAFSDNYDEPNNYLILQVSMEIEEQDELLGIANHYLEVNDSLLKGYGLCKSVELCKNKVIVTTYDKTVIELNIDKYAIDNMEAFIKHMRFILGASFIIIT